MVSKDRLEPKHAINSVGTQFTRVPMALLSNLVGASRPERFTKVEGKRALFTDPVHLHSTGPSPRTNRLAEGPRRIGRRFASDERRAYDLARRAEAMGLRGRGRTSNSKAPNLHQ